MQPSSMMRSLIRIFVLICLGCLLIPTLLDLAGRSSSASVTSSAALLIKSALFVCIALIATAVFYYLLKRVAAFIDSNASEQAYFLDTFSPKYIDIAIISSAALSLFLELAIIRWQSSVLEFF